MKEEQKRKLILYQAEDREQARNRSSVLKVKSVAYPSTNGRIVSVQHQDKCQSTISNIFLKKVSCRRMQLFGNSEQLHTDGHERLSETKVLQP